MPSALGWPSTMHATAACDHSGVILLCGCCISLDCCLFAYYTDPLLPSSPEQHQEPRLEVDLMERGSSVVERRTRNQVSPGSNPPLLPFR